jgi:hypothetical protein
MGKAMEIEQRRKLLKGKYIRDGIRIAALTPISDIDLYLSMLESGAVEGAQPLVAPIDVFALVWR